jgi:hypothetical protein
MAECKIKGARWTNVPAYAKLPTGEIPAARHGTVC